MDKKLIVREANEHDLDAIIQLFGICLRAEGGSPTEEFWRWKHQLNPFGKSPVLLALDGETLVGLRAFLQWQWQWNGAFYKSFRAVDTATHPHFQGKGIFRSLTTQLWNQIQQDAPGCFIYNTPNDQSRPGYLKMGWQILGKPAAAFNWVPGLGLQRQRKWEEAVEALFALDVNSLPVPSSGNHAPPCIVTHAFGAYYHWRYRLIPDRKYGYWKVATRHGEAGFIFYLRQRARFTELRVCDAFVLEAGNAAHQVLQEGYQRLAKAFAGCVVTYLCSPKKKGSTLLQRYIPHVTLRLPENRESLPQGIADIRCWHFEMGALELF